MLRARRHFEHCVRESREAGELGLLLTNLPMLAITRVYACEIDAAIADAEESISLAARLGDLRAEVLSLLAAFSTLSCRGRHREAHAAATRSAARAREIGAARFEAEATVAVALASAALGERAEAADLLRHAVPMALELCASYCGPFALGALAFVTRAPEERADALARGEALLARGAVSHNHIDFRRFAIEACLEDADYAGVERHADALARYTASEPLPLTELVIGRARALASARGKRPSKAVAARLARVAATAEVSGYLEPFGPRPEG
jgi:hypothetical protein